MRKDGFLFKSEHVAEVTQGSIGKELSSIILGLCCILSLLFFCSPLAVAKGGTGLSGNSSVTGKTADSIEARLELLVERLTSQLGSRDHTGLAVHDFTYRDTRLGSPAGRYLTDRFISNLSRHPGFSVIGYTETKSIVGTTNSRGIKLVSTSVDEITLQLGCDYYLKGQYWDIRDKVIKLHAWLYTPEQQLKASTMIEIPTDLIPSSVGLQPGHVDNSTISHQAPPSEAGSAPVLSTSLDISLKTNRGEEAIYYDGESFNVFFSFNHPWYARIYYQQADGTILELYPDVEGGEGKLEPNRIYSIPDSSLGFEFEVSEPFGFEEIVAIVSKKNLPFPGEVGESRFREYKKGFDELLKDLFPRGEIEGESARTSVMITTIPR